VSEPTGSVTRPGKGTWQVLGLTEERIQGETHRSFTQQDSLKIQVKVQRKLRVSSEGAAQCTDLSGPRHFYGLSEIGYFNFMYNYDFSRKGLAKEETASQGQVRTKMVNLEPRWRFVRHLTSKTTINYTLMKSFCRNGTKSQKVGGFTNVSDKCQWVVKPGYRWTWDWSRALKAVPVSGGWLQLGSVPSPCIRAPPSPSLMASFCSLRCRKGGRTQPGGTKAQL
jgi:hypothetical protein